MKTFSAHFCTDTHWAQQDFEADSASHALALAKEFLPQHLDDLMFEAYSAPSHMNEISIHDEDEQDEESAIWQDDDLRLRLAAAKLLETVRYCDMTLSGLRTSKRKGYVAHAIKLIARRSPRSRQAVPHEPSREKQSRKGKLQTYHVHIGFWLRAYDSFEVEAGSKAAAIRKAKAEGLFSRR